MNGTDWPMSNTKNIKNKSVLSHLFYESIIYVATFLVNGMNVVKIQIKTTTGGEPINIF